MTNTPNHNPSATPAPTGSRTASTLAALVLVRHREHAVDAASRANIHASAEPGVIDAAPTRRATRQAAPPILARVDPTGSYVASAARCLIHRRRAMLLWLVIALFTGVATAWTSLSIGEPAERGPESLNALFFVSATLGPHTVLFVLSLLLTTSGLLRSSASESSRFLAVVAARHRESAFVTTHMHAGRRGVLRNAVVSHAGGLVFTLGVLAALLVATTVRQQFQFFWESTLLTDEQVVKATGLIMTPLNDMGMTTPTRADVIAAGVPSTDTLDRSADRRWAAGLLALIAVYGVLPRFLALCCCLVALRCLDEAWSTRTVRDIIRDAITRSHTTAEQRDEPNQISNDDTQQQLNASPVPDSRPVTRPLAITLDLTNEQSDRVARIIHGFADLSVANTHVDRAGLLDLLAGAPHRPAATVIITSIGETPTGAIAAFIRRVADAIGAVPHLILAMRGPDRGVIDHAMNEERLQSRQQSWRRLATQIVRMPSDRVIDLDLGVGDSQIREMLRSLLDPEVDAVRPGQSHEAAISRAVSLLMGTDFEPPLSDEHFVRLFNTIGDQFSTSTVHAPRPLPDFAEVRDRITQNAIDVTRLLGPLAVRKPGWLIAGALSATAGTLAGLAVAAGPAAVIAAYPLWPLYSAAGATIGEVLGRQVSLPGIEESYARQSGTQAMALAIHIARCTFASLDHVETQAAIRSVLDKAGEPSTGSFDDWCDRLRNVLTDEYHVRIKRGPSQHPS